MQTLIAAHPRDVAQATPDKIAVVFGDSGAAISYRELVDRSDQAAQLFASMGIGEGETIALLLENHIRYPELIWAAKNSGFRYVTISTHLNAADIAYILEDCGARLLVTSQAMRDVVAGALSTLSAAPQVLTVDAAHDGFGDYESLIAGQPAVPLTGRRRGPSMLYSSGTTGRPKGVATAIPDAPPEVPPQRFTMLMGQYDFSTDTVFINAGPFYHAAPQRFMMTVLRSGGTAVVFTRFDPAAVLAAITRFRATHGIFVPTMFSRMLALDPAIKAAADTSSMQHAVHTSAPCPVGIKRAMIDWWGPVIDEIYGGTESFGHTFITSPEWLAHPGSVGRPAPNCRIKIVDSNGQPVAAGVNGRVMMCNGMHVAYHRDAEKTARLYDAEGFASLGDVGYLDEEGFLYLTDRESHMIIVGGVNVYPQEAEAVLGEHPAVADVAVIGEPCDDLGERVAAIVKPAPGYSSGPALEAELLAFCTGRLSRFKCPRKIEFRDDLPRTPVGKLVKRELKLTETR